MSSTNVVAITLADCEVLRNSEINILILGYFAGQQTVFLLFTLAMVPTMLT